MNEKAGNQKTTFCVEDRLNEPVARMSELHTPPIKKLKLNRI